MRFRRYFFATFLIPFSCCIWPVTISLIDGLPLAVWLFLRDRDLASQLTAAERRDFQMNRWHAIHDVEPYMVPQLWDTEWQQQLGMLRTVPIDTALSYGAPEHLSALPRVPSQWVYLPEPGGIDNLWNSAFDRLIRQQYIDPPEYLFAVMSAEISPFLETVWHVRRPAFVYFKVNSDSHKVSNQADLPEFESSRTPRFPVDVYVAELPLLVPIQSRPLSHFDQVSLLTNGTIHAATLPTWNYMRQTHHAYIRQYRSLEKRSLFLSSVAHIDNRLGTHAAWLRNKALCQYLTHYTVNIPLTAFALYNHNLEPYISTYLGSSSAWRPLFIALHPNPYKHSGSLIELDNASSS